MKKGYTDIILLIDRSGSMASIKDDMEGGLKVFIEEQKKLDSKCLLTYYKFDERFEPEFEGSDIQSIESINIAPRGMTALYDAIGKSVNLTIERLEKLKKTQKPKHVIFVIITDGQENCSKEFSNAHVKLLIEKQTKDSSWNFVYLGANQDAFGNGQSMGIQGASAMTYTTSSAGIKNMLNSTTRNIYSMRADVTCDTFAFSDKDREDSVK